MKKDSKRFVGGLAGSALMATAAVAGLMPAGVAVAADEPVSATAVGNVQDASAAAALAEAVTVRSAVVGEFGYSQDAVSMTFYIANVFSKAASALCQGIPQYGVSSEGSAAILVRNGGGAGAEMTVGQMAAAADEQSAYVMACSCATNAAGGGAIANAQVQGVKLASVAAQAGALRG